MKYRYFWPATIIATGCALWRWQWQATRRLSQRAEELSNQLNSMPSAAISPAAKVSFDGAKPESGPPADTGLQLLQNWQQKSAAAFSEMTALKLKLETLRENGNESGAGALVFRISELVAMVDATIESDDAAKLMLDAFLIAHPSGRKGGGEISTEAEVLGHRLLRNKPEALLELQTPDRPDLGVLAALARVVETNLTRADAWMRADPQRMTNPDLLGVWLGGIASRDASAGLAALKEVAALDPQAALAGIPTVATHLRSNAERLQLLAHAAAEPDIARRTELVRSVFGKISTLAESRDLFSSISLPGSAKDQIATEISTRNLAEEPEKRGDWLLSQTTDEGRPEALRQFISAWTSADYNAAGTWLGQLPVGPARDTAVADFAGLIRDLDPEAAQSWASTVSDPVLRQSVLQRIEAKR